MQLIQTTHFERDYKKLPAPYPEKNRWKAKTLGLKSISPFIKSKKGSKI